MNDAGQRVDDALAARLRGEARRRHPHAVGAFEELPPVGLGGLRAFVVPTQPVVPPVLEVLLVLGDEALWPGDVGPDERMARVFAWSVAGADRPAPRPLARGLLLAMGRPSTRLLAAGDGGIPVVGEAQAREVRALASRIAAPSVTPEPPGWRAAFVTWCARTGDVERHEVRWAAGGGARSRATALARAVGDRARRR